MMKYFPFFIVGILIYQTISFSDSIRGVQKTQDMILINQEILHTDQQEISQRVQKLESGRVLVTSKPVGPIPEVRVPEVPAKAPEAPVKDGLKIVKTNRKLKHEQLDIFCMAKNIYHEAGNQNRLGKYAVAQVTINRKLSPEYPNTVCEVVMQDFQFSWANDRKIRWTRPKGPVWNESLKIAEDVIRNGKRVHGLGTALFYHADYVSPNWRKPEAKIAKVGTHIFYADAR